ncbi:hypothetical protein [Sporichthya sp.]|uniref:hypothetical protein n=1 Tax=Sporichthya sp. TaxID=65475 RepID=UPI0017D0FA19|nr:hypothetical protein [Sporichthya sp.]MBA3743537.1 hypothetical protein [Sporichthya sp.]
MKTFGDGDRKGYGGIEQCAQPCISPLHTHDPDGILHTEAKQDTLNTLGQFFTVWGISSPRTASLTGAAGSASTSTANSSPATRPRSTCWTSGRSLS